MAKFSYIQDGHCKGISSQNRLGNYFEDWLIKLDEILNIAKENRCDAILDGGDLLEVKNPAYNVLDEIADRIEKVGIPFYSLHGNHALHCGHIENSINTGLTHLQRRSKLFHYLDRIEGIDWQIVGFDYFFGIEDKLKKDGIYWNEEIGKNWKIAIVHAMVTPKNFFKDASYILPKQIKTNADLVLCAHYHAPFKKIINNTTFLNIGAFGRLNINEAEIEPSVLLMDTDKRDYEIIKLKSAKSSDKIFDLSNYEKIKEQIKSIDSFLNSLNNVKFNELSVLGQIEKIGKENSVEKKVVNYLIEKSEKIKNE